jgi:membrane protein YdbS with pleckstrin-like domain
MDKEKERLRLGKINMLLLVLAAIVLVLAYVIMSFNEISISPVLLLIAYVVIIPFALLWQPSKR